MNVLKHGLRENLNPFILLVVVNAFVGGMVGLERTVFPLYAQRQFGITSHAAVLSFITAFGFSKALANYFAGKGANVTGRKNILLLGWIIALPIPFLLIHASSWSWVVFANVLLGVSQGFTWSSTVVMKIDLVGEKQRGLAMGINEFAGYVAVGLMAFATGYLTQHLALIPYAFIPGMIISGLGFLLTLFWVKDTKAWVHAESKFSNTPIIEKVFVQASFKHNILSSVTQAGLVNNLNDGMIWGLLPVLLMSRNYSIETIGTITALYPIVWGSGQLITGKMADKYSRKALLFWGMTLQAVAIFGFLPVASYGLLMICSIALGVGTAMIYPTFLVVFAAHTHPTQRAEAMGIFRLWRDSGYAIGAISSGLIADAFGIEKAILFTGLITLLSAAVIAVRYPSKQEVSSS